MPRCVPCDREFRTSRAYRRHLLDSSTHNYCDDCSRDFDSRSGLTQHYIQSPNHHYCRHCDSHFRDSGEVRTHYINVHIYCAQCDQIFRSATDLHEHNRQCHHYCTDCRDVFDCKSYLRMHSRDATVPCGFQHCGCTETFANEHAMILHLESGSCSANVDRRTIDQWVQLSEYQDVDMVSERLLTYGGGDPRYSATERSWNGVAYECVLCHKIHDTLDALNRHLASPRHTGKKHCCPHSPCLTRFTTLRGLCQHVENESCGVPRFRAAREGMDRLMKDMGKLRIQ